MNNPLDKVYLSKSQLEDLASGGTITLGDDSYSADLNTLYLTPEGSGIGTYYVQLSFNSSNNQLTINVIDENNVVIDTSTTTITISELSNKVDKNTAITAGTNCKITYDSKGLVTAGASLSESDIPSLSESKITNLSTDLQNIREVAEGKCKSFAVDETSSGNTGFNSSDTYVTVLSFTDVDGNSVDVTKLNKGDIVWTTGTGVYDRWLSNPTNGTWYILDASSPQLSNYYSKTDIDTNFYTKQSVDNLLGNKSGKIYQHYLTLTVPRNDNTSVNYYFVGYNGSNTQITTWNDVLLLTPSFVMADYPYIAGLFSNAVIAFDVLNPSVGIIDNMSTITISDSVNEL